MDSLTINRDWRDCQLEPSLVRGGFGGVAEKLCLSSDELNLELLTVALDKVEEEVQILQ